MNAIIISIIGAAIILDKYAIGEFGISQPILSGTIIGALFGNIQTGIFLGAMFQLIFLAGLPIGRDIPPDGQAAGIIGCSSYFLLKTSNTAGHALLLAIIFALLGAIVGGILEIVTRRYNEKLYHIFMRRRNSLSICHLAGLLTAFLRGLFLFLCIFAIASTISVPSQFPQISRELFMVISVSIGLANTFYLFIKRSTAIYVILGGLCGLALLAF